MESRRKKRRILLVLSVVLAGLALFAILTTMTPSLKIPGAKLWVSNHAVSIYEFEKGISLGEVIKLLESDGWEIGPKQQVPHASTRDWIVRFVKGNDEMATYGRIAVTSGSKTRTGPFALLWRKPTLPEFIYSWQQWFRPEVQINLSPP